MEAVAKKANNTVSYLRAIQYLPPEQPASRGYHGRKFNKTIKSEHLPTLLKLF